MRIVTVCGSMRYYNQMLALANELTLEGDIVLLPFVLKTGDSRDMDASLQRLHQEKIAMSEAVYIIAGTHDGLSTTEETAYALSLDKQVWIYKGEFPAIGDQDRWEQVSR